MNFPDFPRPAPVPDFPGRSPTHCTPVGESLLSLNRMTIDVPRGSHECIRMPGEDAYVVLFQLHDHPAHDICLDGRMQRAAPTFGGALHIIHLESEPQAWLEAPVDTLFFHLPVSAIEEIAKQAGASWDGRLQSPLEWRTADPVVAQLQPLLMQTLTRPSPEHQLMHDHLMRGLGTHFVNTYGGLKRRRPVLRGGLAQRHERLAKEMLAAELDTTPSIVEVARACGLSPDHFTRAFKVSTNTTPREWLQQLRIDRAKHLLRTSSASLGEVATACGFADQSHLSRTFVRHAGIAPGAWRRSMA